MKDAGGATDTTTDDTITVTINVTDSPTLTIPPHRPTPSTVGGGGVSLGTDHRPSPEATRPPRQWTRTRRRARTRPFGPAGPSGDTDGCRNYPSPVHPDNGPDAARALDRFPSTRQGSIEHPRAQAATRRREPPKGPKTEEGQTHLENGALRSADISAMPHSSLGCRPPGPDTLDSADPVPVLLRLA